MIKRIYTTWRRQLRLYTILVKQTLTLGARDRILLQRPLASVPPTESRSAAETTPLTRVPIISPLLLSRTQALSSKLVGVSGRETCKGERDGEGAGGFWRRA